MKPFAKGPPYGHTSSGATRWMMRSSNGSQWATQYRYYRDEVEKWWFAKPLWPL